ncbi:hypothetical protein ACOMHN_039523 [Nucella lapillus]
MRKAPRRRRIPPLWRNNNKQTRKQTNKQNKTTKQTKQSYTQNSPPRLGLIYDGQSGQLPQEVDRAVEEANQQPSNIHLMTRTVYVDASDSFNVSRARIASATLSTCHHKSRANRGKTAVLIGDTENWTVDGKSQHMANTTSSALWQCPLCMCSLLSTGAIVLLGHAGRPTLDTIRAYSESLEIPFIFFNNPADPRSRGVQGAKEGLQYYLKPSITKAIVDVIQTFGWSSLTYIYATDEALFRLEQVHDYTHEYHYAPEISARFVQNASACLHLLRTLHNENRNRNIRVILDLDPVEAQFIIESVTGAVAEWLRRRTSNPEGPKVMRSNPDIAW